MKSSPNTRQVTSAAAPRHPAHAARPGTGTGRLVSAVAGVAVLLGTLVFAIAVLSRSGGPATSTPTSAQLITVTGKVPLLRP
ncbi:MAG: hypothetical protein WBC17_17270 [Mycobacterium sp.]